EDRSVRTAGVECVTECDVFAGWTMGGVLLDPTGRRSHLGQSRNLRRAVSAHWRKASSPGGGHRFPSGVVARRKEHLFCSHGGSTDGCRVKPHAVVANILSGGRYLDRD